MDCVTYFPITIYFHNQQVSTLRVLSYGSHDRKGFSCLGCVASLKQVMSPKCLQPSLRGYCNCQCNESEWAPYKNFRTHPHVILELWVANHWCDFVCCVCFYLILDWGPLLMTMLGPPFLYEQQLMLRGGPHQGPNLPSALPISATTHTYVPWWQLLWRQCQPPPMAPGFSNEPASWGSGFCGMVPTAHFPLGSLGNHQKATTPDANSPFPSDKFSIPLLRLGWLQGGMCQRRVACKGRLESSRAGLSAVLVQL